VITELLAVAALGVVVGCSWLVSLSPDRAKRLYGSRALRTVLAIVAGAWGLSLAVQAVTLRARCYSGLDAHYQRDQHVVFDGGATAVGAGTPNRFASHWDPFPLSMDCTMHTVGLSGAIQGPGPETENYLTGTATAWATGL
jgi:hypothetical protein